MNAELKVADVGERYPSSMLTSEVNSFELLATSSDGLSRLRELILSLAVSGRLFEPLTNSSSSQLLLDAVLRKREEAAREGIIPKKLVDPLVNEEWEPPFHLPNGWTWATLDQLAPISLTDGDWIESKDQDAAGSIRLLQLADIGNGTFKDKSSRYINEETFKRLNCTKLEVGDILIARLPSPIGRACRFPGLSRDAITVVDVAILRLAGIANTDYVVLAINSPIIREQIESYGKGATRFRIATGNLKTVVLPVPPLSEQNRIVVRVEELMKLCDALEKNGRLEAEQHARLVSTLFDTLAASESPQALTENWRRIAQHFDLLLDRPEAVDALEKTLLQLAVRGLLVKQEDEDEPAAELLVRLRKERQDWLQDSAASNAEAGSMLRKLSELPKPVAPFVVPTSWEFVHAIDCCRMLVDCHNKTAPYTAAGVPIIRTSNVRNTRFRLDDLRYVSNETYNFWSRRCPPAPGDIIFTREAPMGEAAIIPEGAKYCLGQRTMLLRPMHDHVIKEYLLLTLIEPGLLQRALPTAIGSTVKHLRVGDVEQLTIPIPPLAEQHRIVTRVKELRELCAQLRERLTSKSSTQSRLAEAIVSGAVAI